MNLTSAEAAELKAAAVKNIVEKIAAGAVPTDRELRMLAKAEVKDGPPPTSKQPAKKGKQIKISAEAATIRVYSLLLEGRTKSEILESLPSLCPGADAKAVLTEAMESLAVVGQEPMSSVIGWCMESARSLYRQCTANMDYAGALACVKEVSRLAAMARK